MRHVSRRAFLDLAAAVAGLTLAGCWNEPVPSGDSTGTGGAGGGGAGGAGGSGGGGGAGGSGGEGGGGPAGNYPVAVTGYEQSSQRAAAIRGAIELLGGIPWLKSGDTVLVKVAHNSPLPYPATASPVACAELVKMLLDAGAKKVYVADVIGLENTIVPGGFALEEPYGQVFGGENDATIRAFKQSGLWGTIAGAVGASNIGPDAPVHLTSFREHGWSRYESAADTAGTPYLVSSWVKDQLEKGERWDGKPITWKYKKRAFDLLNEDVPGMYVPNLISDVDHIVNLHRISTHVMSHFTLAIKNWVGIMRPDDRIWMHQLSYLLNHRGKGADPIRTEPPYNEMLAELHASTRSRERLVLADASQVIASGGPDESDKDLFPAQLVVAAGDVVTADVVGLSIIRMAVMASQLQGGLGGVCSPPPQSAEKLAVGALATDFIPWRPPVMYGNDAKLCDPTFSHWDWVALQRARELGMGCKSPDDMDLRLAQDGDFALPEAQAQWLSNDTTLPPDSGA